MYTSQSRRGSHTPIQRAVRQRSQRSTGRFSTLRTYVANFWTRFGTPTAAADSGTAEETSRSLAAGKRVLVYFSDRPKPPSEIDREQYEKVTAFRGHYAAQGLYGTYTTLDAFRDQFRTHLALLMDDLCGTARSDHGTYDVEQPISVAMAPTYWVIVLAALGQAVQHSARRGAELAAQGIRPEDVSDTDRTALTAPLLIHAFLVDILVKHGVMKPDVSDRIGYDAVLRAAGYRKDPK